MVHPAVQGTGLVEGVADAVLAPADAGRVGPTQSWARIPVRVGPAHRPAGGGTSSATTRLTTSRADHSSQREEASRRPVAALCRWSKAMRGPVELIEGGRHALRSRPTACAWGRHICIGGDPLAATRLGRVMVAAGCPATGY
jgi:hypothetical protein